MSATKFVFPCLLRLGKSINLDSTPSQQRYNASSYSLNTLMSHPLENTGKAKQTRVCSHWDCRKIKVIRGNGRKQVTSAGSESFASGMIPRVTRRTMTSQLDRCHKPTKHWKDLHLRRLDAGSVATKLMKKKGDSPTAPRLENQKHYKVTHRVMQTSRPVSRYLHLSLILL